MGTAGRPLVVASVIFGLSHFNKRLAAGAHFNWRYVLLASISGIFRWPRPDATCGVCPASTITHMGWVAVLMVVLRRGYSSIQFAGSLNSTTT